jgi:hypothetical protein
MRKRNLLFGRECSLPLDLFVSTKIHPREIKINDMCNRFSNQEYFSLISSLRRKLPILGYPLLDGRQSAPV